MTHVGTFTCEACFQHVCAAHLDRHAHVCRIHISVLQAHNTHVQTKVCAVPLAWSMAPTGPIMFQTVRSDQNIRM